MSGTQPSAARRLSVAEMLVLLAALALARLIAQRVCHIYDDAFITYRYAWNLARGLGMVFNPGAEWEPVLGTTTPGYTAWLAANARLGLNVVQASLFWNVCFDVLSGFLLITLLDRKRLRATLTVLGFACLPELARISAGGMEAPMLLCLVLVTLVCARRQAWWLAGIGAAAACTVRPESVLLVGILALQTVRDRRQLVAFLGPVAVIGLLYTWLLTSFYGSPIPQSVLSKAAVHGGSPLLATWGEIAQQAFLPRLIYLPVLPLVCVGLVRSLRESNALQGLTVFGLGISLAYFVARPHTWGWYYYVPLCAWVFWIANGVLPLASWSARRWPRGAGVCERLGVPAATLAALAIVWAGTLRMRDDVSRRVYEPMAEWAREARLEERGVSLLASDIGAIAYLTDALVYDSQGLTWPAALEVESQMDLILRVEPDYLLLVAERAEIGPMREREEVTRAYYPIRRFSVAGQTDLQPALDELPDHWTQDYLLYRRNF